MTYEVTQLSNSSVTLRYMQNKKFDKRDMTGQTDFTANLEAKIAKKDLGYAANGILSTQHFEISADGKVKDTSTNGVYISIKDGADTLNGCPSKFKLFNIDTDNLLLN